MKMFLFTIRKEIIFKQIRNFFLWPYVVAYKNNYQLFYPAKALTKKIKQQDDRMDILDTTVKCIDQPNNLMKPEGSKCLSQT